jgi:plastocyanin
MRRAFIIVIVLSIAVAATPASLAAGGKSVTITGSYGYYSFSPKTVTIKKGKTVTWSWNSDEKHNVTFAHRHSATKKHVSGYVLTFNKVGTFHYTCTVHGFGGKVVVKAP